MNPNRTAPRATIKITVTKFGAFHVMIDCSKYLSFSNEPRCTFESLFKRVQNLLR